MSIKMGESHPNFKVLWRLFCWHLYSTWKNLEMIGTVFSSGSCNKGDVEFLLKEGGWMNALYVCCKNKNFRYILFALFWFTLFLIWSHGEGGFLLWFRLEPVLMMCFGFNLVILGNRLYFVYGVVKPTLVGLFETGVLRQSKVAHSGV